MVAVPALPAEPPLLERIDALLADPAHADNPLRAPLAQLHATFLDQIAQLDRITRISDHYQAAERERGHGYALNYRQQLRRLEKIVRISDRYQGLLRDLNQRLEWLSNRDPLTGLPNRRNALARMHEEQLRSQRTGKPFALAIADIDHFKDINDTWGHEAGDRVLAAVATTLASSVREYDLCARWGGEEFLVLLPEIDAAGAYDSAARLCASIGGRVQVEGHEIAVTVSLGAGSSEPGEDLAQLMKRVDEALYRAKRSGRNRFELASPARSTAPAFDIPQPSG